ncbi:MAG: hypothetical protein PHH31_09800 [Acidaminococcaceae bacterium]|nr:hypothetical protein [Acidaminococcaceae bacterium]
MRLFEMWLISTKGYSKKSSHDVLSRKKRVLTILGTEKIDASTLSTLEKNLDFLALSMTVKSQLRRAVRLTLEFENT